MNTQTELSQEFKVSAERAKDRYLDIVFKQYHDLNRAALQSHFYLKFDENFGDRFTDFFVRRKLDECRAIVVEASGWLASELAAKPEYAKGKKFVGAV